MLPFLVDINLQHVPDPYLVGTWRVVERTLNHANPTDLLAQATCLHMQEGALRLDTPGAPAPTLGHWQIERDSLLSRPYLRLQLAHEQVTALVTRLRRSLDGEYRALALYFQSGLELLLVQP